MTNCMVISLYLWQQQVAVRCQELPPLCLPQQLLPEEARFAGVGLIGDADVYLYAVDAPFSGPMKPEADARGALTHLLALAAKPVPQDFALIREDGVWTLSAQNLDEDVYQ